jgi:ABC-type nitrate/sulfonate/bicarbonate transport system permease component
MNRRFDWLGAAGSIGVLLALIALWWAASHGGWISRVFLPSPEATLDSLVEGLGAGGELLAFTGATVGRMLLGWGLASALGVALGALIGSSAAARVWIAPTLEAIRPLPASAVMPLAMAIFGLSGSMVLAVVAFGAMWPVLLATVHGLAHVHPQLREVSQALHLPRRAFIWKIGLPNALPDILAGMRLSMTVSLIVSVVGEMVASQPGLGQAILLASRSFHAPHLCRPVDLPGERRALRPAALCAARSSTSRTSTPWSRSQPFFPGLQKNDLPDGEGWAVEKVQLSTHNGTHLDAPWHFHSTRTRRWARRSRRSPSTRCRWSGASSPA